MTESPPSVVIDGVPHRCCGEGRKQRRAGSIECGRILPVTAKYWPVNSGYSDGFGIVCLECREKQEAKYAERLNTAIVPIKVYDDVPVGSGTCRGVMLDVNGEHVPHLVVIEACRYWGLDSTAQLQRIGSDPVLLAGLIPCKLQGISSAKPVYALRYDLVPAWLNGIETAKMRNRERAAQLAAFQRVCAQVLADYFFGTSTAPLAPRKAEPITTPQPHAVPEVTGVIIRLEDKVDRLHGKVDNIERRLDRITTMTELVVCTGFVYVAAFDHTLPFDVQDADAMIRKGYVLVAIGETTKPVAQRLREYVGKLPIRPPRLLKAIGTDNHKRAESLLHNERPVDVHRALPTDAAAQRSFRDLFWAQVEHLEYLVRLPNQVRCDELERRLRGWQLRDDVYAPLNLWEESV